MRLQAGARTGPCRARRARGLRRPDGKLREGGAREPRAGRSQRGRDGSADRLGDDLLVWDMQGGYPAASAYRDYHRKTRYDLKPWNVAGAPYNRADAVALAREHARDFVAKVSARLADYAEQRGRPGIVCCALDTELLGHWWYEGPVWLAAVIEEAAAAGLELHTVSDALARCVPVERPLATSTWGADKDLSTWDCADVAEIAF